MVMRIIILFLNTTANYCVQPRLLSKDGLTVQLQSLSSDTVKTPRMIVELLVSQIGWAGIAEENVRGKAAAGVTAAVCGAIMCATAKTLVYATLVDDEKGQSYE